MMSSSEENKAPTSNANSSSMCMGDQHKTASSVSDNNSEKPIQGALDTIDHQATKSRESESVELAEALHRTLRVEKSNNLSSSSSALTTESKRASDVVTPPSHELSPGMLNSLRGSSSPSYSQVSVGSIGPSIPLPPMKPYDLTPVTRNTSGEYAAPVTPGEFLHGEHLALPADLNEDTPGPSLPPLKMSPTKPPIVAIGLPPEGNEEPPMVPAIQFPARKFYSFTTREQYEEMQETYDLSDDDDDEDLDLVKLQAQILKPYAPSRRADNFGIESLPDEELQQIFCTEGKAPHRLSAIPLEGRIPSLHLANVLHGESLASITSYCTDGDEEDSLINIHDDVEDDCGSLNSLSHHDDDDDPIRRKQRKRKQALKEERAVEWLQSLGSGSEVAEAASSKFLTQRSEPIPRKAPLELKRITSTPVGQP